MNPDKTATRVYSLWLMPTGQTAARLQMIITQLSRKYSTPVFEPHVTLTGEFDLPENTAISRTQELATRLEPFRIILQEPAHFEDYFRCVFLKVEKTDILLRANAIAQSLFGQEDPEEYMPHLSLIYGDLRPQARQNIILEIGSKIDIEFLAKDLHLYYTGGQPRNWHRISTIPFTSGCP